MDILLYKNFNDVNVATFDKNDLLQWQEQISKLLSRFQAIPNHENLKKLAIEGYNFKNMFLYSFRNDKLKFKNEFIKVINESIRNKEPKHKRRICITYPYKISFPFHMMYLKDPEEIDDWNKIELTELMNYFLGLNLKIYYRFKFYIINQ